MHLRVVLWHAERARVDAVAAIETTRLQRGHHYAVVGNLDRIRGTNECTRGLVAMHANGRHRCGCFSAIHVIDKDHRITLVRGAFAAGGDTGSAANATLRIDEHRLFHYPFLTSLNEAPFRC